jgi:hypothetical protein
VSGRIAFSRLEMMTGLNDFILFLAKGWIKDKGPMF